MLNLLRTLALLIMLLPSAAFAQCNSSTPLPINTVLGRLGIQPGPCQAIPFAQLSLPVIGNAFVQFAGPTTPIKTFTLPNTNATLAALGVIQTWTAAQSFTDGKLILLGSSSGSATLKAPATGGGTATLFGGSDTIAGIASAQTLTNKTFDCSSNTCTVRIANDVTGLATGIATWLNTPSSANLAAALTDETGTGAAVFANTPTLVTPVLGAATATTINKVTITAPATSATLTLQNNTTVTGPAATGTLMTLGNAETVSGTKTFNDATVLLAGSSSGTTTVKASATASGTVTLPAATDTLVGKATTDTLTNKTLDSAGTGNTLKISGVTVSAGQLPGTATNDSATAGNIGEIVTSNVASPGSSITSTTPGNVTSVSLTAGDWDCSGNIGFVGNTGTVFTQMIASIGTTTGSIGTAPNAGGYTQISASTGTATTNLIPVGPTRISLSGSATAYLVQDAVFSGGTATAFGYLRCRRER